MVPSERKRGSEWLESRRGSRKRTRGEFGVSSLKKREKRGEAKADVKESQGGMRGERRAR